MLAFSLGMTLVFRSFEIFIVFRHFRIFLSPKLVLNPFFHLKIEILTIDFFSVLVPVIVPLELVAVLLVLVLVVEPTLELDVVQLVALDSLLPILRSQQSVGHVLRTLEKFWSHKVFVVEATLHAALVLDIFLLKRLVVVLVVAFELRPVVWQKPLVGELFLLFLSVEVVDLLLPVVVVIALFVFESPRHVALSASSASLLGYGELHRLTEALAVVSVVIMSLMRIGTSPTTATSLEAGSPHVALWIVVVFFLRNKASRLTSTLAVAAFAPPRRGSVALKIVLLVFPASAAMMVLEELLLFLEFSL